MTRDARHRLLFVARFVPWPALSGAPIRMQHLLVSLAEAFDVTLIAHDAGEEAPVALPGVRYVPVHHRSGSKRLAQLAGLPWRRSYGYGRYATTALRRAVLANAPARLVHFDDPGSALGGRVPGAVNVVAPHDIESRITLGGAAQGDVARRTFAAIDGRRQAREERAVCRAMDLCVAVSDVDAALLRQAGARRVIVCPNGTDPVPRLPPPSIDRHEPLRLLFVANGDFAPNARGLRWLIEEVLPLVPVAHALDVVGRPPARPLRSPAVLYHGRVPDLRPHYERAHVAVAPIPFGSGTRLKIVEAMAHGRPVVSTAAGAEGLPVRAGRDYLESDTPAEFAAALAALAADLAAGDGRLERMLAAARVAAEGLFWPSIGRQLAERYLAVADAGRAMSEAA
jgi:polysaccharide biosynthesis protein PslH